MASLSLIWPLLLPQIWLIAAIYLLLTRPRQLNKTEMVKLGQSATIVESCAHMAWAYEDPWSEWINPRWLCNICPGIGMQTFLKYLTRNEMKMTI